MIILYTGTKCPKCPNLRKLLREVCKELGLIEGKDFVEKLIDGSDMKPGKIILEGEEVTIVEKQEDITSENIPAIMACEDYSLEALTFQIAAVPSIVRDGNVLFNGEIPEKEQLLEALK